MADLAADMRRAYELKGDTYSSMEIFGLLSRAAAEIERRKEKYPYSELDMDMHVEAVTKELRAEIERLRAAAESARQAIQYSIDMVGTDPAGVLLQALNKCDAALAPAPTGKTP